RGARHRLVFHRSLVGPAAARHGLVLRTRPCNRATAFAHGRRRAPGCAVVLDRLVCPVYRAATAGRHARRPAVLHAHDPARAADAVERTAAGAESPGRPAAMGLARPPTRRVCAAEPQEGGAARRPLVAVAG